ncbi:acyltransferase, putative, left-handed parallel beta-helix hexapeptide repeat protein [Syntrophotalea carbinolica DSM 2380]|uniref:Acyltransferase, putative, left-handed parallel beta-helix hexapeptide repeat protein n=1 Tax=Syntrophotalea carbinolica (strain DSM 2380 / NBRC 103641 / GraBd1) TaxID=338963 RepID=Q3A3L9_SYNC1|nr:acyltransferase [Syntrophotalea carbinolica]ABA89038.2 acyltransferase, putative, left-handed parallel beta-helix hexapeptide repeat protein [Syntrophotalea carbinolica DSM 2380]
MKHSLLLIYSYIVRVSTYFFPDIPFLMSFRGFLYSLGMKSSGRNFQVSSSALIRGLQFLSVGENVFVAHNCTILAGCSVSIGSNVLVGVGSVITDGNHSYKDKTGYRFGLSKRKPVVILQGSWIGGNCVVLPGSEFPQNSVLAANSTYRMRSDDENSLFSGNPAVFIKYFHREVKY